MNFVPAPTLSLAFFVALIVGLVLTYVYSVYFATDRMGANAAARTNWFAVGLFLLLGFYAALVRSSLLAEYPWPLLPLVFAVLILIAVGLSFSRVGTWLSKGLTLKGLVLFQVFRLPLEIILHDWSNNGTVPESMTWTGQNMDIATGILALASFAFVEKSKVLAWAVNTVGFLLLLNVMRIVVSSFPLPMAFHLPYALIAPLCVAGALVGHLVLYRKLLSTR